MTTITTEQLRAIHEATGGELYDADWNGGEWMYAATETRETLQNFIDASTGWNECSKQKAGTFAGFPFVAWANAQARKGQQRQPLSVIDFGEWRIAVRADVTDYE